MTESKLRPLAASILFPLALAGCDAQLSVTHTTQVLATLNGPFGLAVDATNVYVSRLGALPVALIPVGGGGPYFINVNAAGRGIAVDEQRLYFSDGKSLAASDKSDGNTVTLAPDQPGIAGLALDATNAYCTVSGSTSPPSIIQVDKSGATPPLQLGTGKGPVNVAVDATSVYWIEQVQPNAGVMKAPIGGGPVVQLAVSDPIEPMGLALDADNVYFANGEGTVYKVAKNGGPTQVVLAALGQFPAGLATDATDLYVAASTRLVRVPLSGGEATTLAEGFAGAIAIALDADSVYVNDLAGNAVLKIKK